ncbi:MAG: 16S rRNA (cytidine(1402)-2'-O)-methyltransferase [Firmicutes bacterium]|nr:16S rRNA (cytidine(1402)-2'-O)-methyltransferase [Bacillota bacterium]
MTVEGRLDRLGGVRAVAGTLYLVAGPIGNLEDITLRALRVLREVDLVAAEDTRQAAKLLGHYEISKPTVSYHSHNRRQVAPRLIERLRRGESVAVLSDAGLPGISDPGGELVLLAEREGIPVTVLPGPSALVTAAALSGFRLDGVSFWGFPPRRPGRRRRFFEALLREGRPFVFYESPHRIVETLADLAALEPGRLVAVARELTKVFEEVIRGYAQAVALDVAAKGPRGEYTVVVGPKGRLRLPGLSRRAAPGDENGSEDEALEEE